METEVITRVQDTYLLHYIDGLYGYTMALTPNQSDAEALVRMAVPAVSLRPGHFNF
jgi:hypothetical protein